MSPPAKSMFATKEEEGSKLSRKVKEDPAMILGITGFLLAGAIGAYKYRHRGNMSTSVFLMQLRVAAQGTVVGCLTVGLAYQMGRDYLFKKENDKKS